MSQLRQAAEDYLQIRRALGYKLQNVGYALPQFIDFLQREGAETVTIELALAWATPGHLKPVSWQRRLIAVRGFATYLQTIDPRAEVPPTDIVASPGNRPVPHIYTDQEIQALMRAAGQWRSRLGRATLQTTIGLLAATGMRISEAINLDRTDVDLAHGRLIVRNSKFGICRNRHMPKYVALRTMLPWARQARGE